MDLITHLPTSEGFNSVFTIGKRFFKYVTFIPCKATFTAPNLAMMFYDQIVCKFGMPKKIIIDKDSRFFVQILISPHALLIVYFCNIKWLSSLDTWLVRVLSLFY